QTRWADQYWLTTAGRGLEPQSTGRQVATNSVTTTAPQGQSKELSSASGTPTGSSTIPRQHCASILITRGSMKKDLCVDRRSFMKQLGVAGGLAACGAASNASSAAAAPTSAPQPAAHPVSPPEAAT